MGALDFFSTLIARLMAEKVTTEWDTAGPHAPGDIAIAPVPAVPPSVEMLDMIKAHSDGPTWVNGWTPMAQHSPVHPSRITAAIKAWLIVRHMTDMPEETFGTLLNNWKKPGQNAAHFLLGRTPAQGLHQLASIYRNANHAGGNPHGSLLVNGRAVHPNSVSIGIEVHGAGEVHLVDGLWRWGESDGRGKPWRPKGKPIPAIEVYPDPARPLRGWHRPTEYQFETLHELEDHIIKVLYPAPPMFSVVADGPQQFKWGAAPVGSLVVGHISLDPENRVDPGPLLMEDLRGRYGWTPTGPKAA